MRRFIPLLSTLALLPAWSAGQSVSGLEEVIRSLDAAERSAPSGRFVYENLQGYTDAFYESTHAPRDSNPADQAIKVTARFKGALRRVVYEQPFLAGKGAKGPTSLRTTVLYGGKETIRLVHSDGPRPKNEEAAYTNATGSDGMISPFYFREYNGEPLSKTLQKGRFQVTGRSRDAQFGASLTVEGVTKEGTNLLLTLAPERGMIATHLEYADPDRNAGIEADVGEMRQVQGHWVPVRARSVAFNRIGGQETPIVETSMTLKGASYGPVSDAEMAVVPKSRTLVNETATGRNYRLVNGRKVYDERTVQPPKTLLGYAPSLAFVGSLAALIALAVGGLVRVAARKATRGKPEPETNLS